MTNLIPFTKSQTVEEVRKLTDEDLEQLGFTDKGKQDFKTFVYESEFWKNIKETPTPPEIVKIREGAKDKNGNPIFFEYAPEDYVVQELDKRFPGWWTDDMRRSSLEEIIKLETVIVEGYLMIPYPTPSGIRIRKLWAVAGNDIKFKKETKIPLDLANNFKGARTEWLRIAAGKWLGVNNDLYTQKVTSGMRALFEERIKDWKPYATHWIKLATTCQSGKTFRIILNTMPSANQLERAQVLLKHIPEIKHQEVWTNFGKLSNATDEDREKFENWLTKMEEISERNRIKKENS